MIKDVKLKIKQLIENTNYDIRIIKSARWIDQKCTPDVISIISDCILNFPDCCNTSFTSKEIQISDYSRIWIPTLFKKPETNEPFASSEYDKFFQQPMKLLSYAGILQEIKKNNKNYYKILDKDILEFLSANEKNVIFFMNLYIQKVLKDSNCFNFFEKFLINQNKQNFAILKNSFIEFTIEHTSIGKRVQHINERSTAGKVECSRIFTKVLNILSFCNNALGTKKGSLSKNVITYDMLMYNKENFRDLFSDKPKNQTRKEFILEFNSKINSDLSYYVDRAKKNVKKYNDIFNESKSEIIESKYKDDLGLHMHHIFPQNIFPEISNFTENLIALTPTEHLSYAHPLGKTKEIDINYQYKCIISKISIISKSLKNDNPYNCYNFYNLKKVLSIGLDNEFFLKVNENDFEKLIFLVNEIFDRTI
ncbi:MAG: hypothetical protein ACRC4L_03995 [Mycoplasma sp.]